MPQAITVSGPLPAGKLVFQSLKGREELGRPFEFRVELLSEDQAIKLDQVLGKNLTITIEFTDERKRYFNGDVVQFLQVSKTIDKYYCYEAVLRPKLWFLSYTNDCKIFQKKSVPDIVKAILDEHGITDVKQSLSATYNPREYCVQYIESYCVFTSCPIEEEVIYYFFEHATDKHTLVPGASLSSHQSIEGEATIPYVLKKTGYSKDLSYNWCVAQQVEPGVVANIDYDFTKPRADLKAQSKITRTHGHADMEKFGYSPGSYAQKADGEGLARKRIVESQVDWETIAGSTNCKAFAAGKLFKLKDYKREDQNREHLLTAAEYEIRMETSTAAGTKAGQLDSAVGIFFDCVFAAISSQRPFAAACTTPRPVVQGPQTAVVVGKSGEEIWTDQYGRVKVQFFWDRLGQKDENSSCWLRVAQVWAGKSWGAINIPRIGEEVIVEFIDGDPDQPIVTGRVYNAEQKVPYDLPTNQTQSGLKSRSTKEGDAEKFNELRFEDKKGEEHVYFHAEKNFDRIVENNDTLKVGFDKKDAGDQTIEIYNNRTTTLEKGTDKLQIKEKDRETIIDKGNDTVTITQGNQTITISKGNQTIKIEAGKGSVEAAQELLLKVGESSIKITPSSIELTSVNIKQTANGQFEASGAQTKVAGSGMLDLDGGTIMMN